MSFRDTILSQARASALAASILGALFVSLHAGPAVADTNSDLTLLRQQLSASNARQQEISDRLNLLSSEIVALKQKLATAALRLKDIDQKMVDTENRLDDISAVEQQTLQMLSRQNAGLADTLSALIQLSRQPEGSLIGSPESLIDTLRAATLLKSVIPALKRQADELGGQLDALASLRDQYIAEQKKFAALRSDRVTEQNALDKLLQGKRTAQAALKSINSRENKKRERLNSKAENLVALLSKLEADKQKRLTEERQRIEKEIRRQESLRQEELARQREDAKRLKEEAENAAPAATASIPTPVPSRKSDASQKPENQQSQQAQIASLPSIGSGKPFSRIKGTLPLPVGGKIVSNYNSTQKRLQRNGIEIETRDGAAVVSPYDGQIAFAGPFRHYGLLLIIDHGEGYHTLLAGLGSIEGDVGQLLLAGEPVGTMRSQGNVKPTLYMELRVKGSPVNPIPWLAAGYRKVSG